MTALRASKYVAKLKLVLCHFHNPVLFAGSLQGRCLPAAGQTAAVTANSADASSFTTWMQLRVWHHGGDDVSHCDNTEPWEHINDTERGKKHAINQNMTKCVSQEYS
ncbi:hypothetical protein ABVT39_025921 [Epinephelus coioides]